MSMSRISSHDICKNYQQINKIIKSLSFDDSIIKVGETKKKKIKKKIIKWC